MMRLSHFLVLAILFSSSSLNAQAKWKSTDNYQEGVHVGYRAAFGGYKEYKDVMKFYNDQRPWLDKSLPESAVMHGIEFALGTQSDFGGATILNMAYSARKNRVKGTLPNGEEFTRSVRISQFSIDAIDAWWTPIHTNGFDLGFGVMPLGVMWCKVGTKYNGEKPEFGPFAKSSFKISNVLLNMDAHSIFHLDLVRRSSDKKTGLRFQFFYFLGWDSNTNDLILLNQEINPNSYQNYRKRTLLRNSHFGIKTSLFI